MRNVILLLVFGLNGAAAGCGKTSQAAARPAPAPAAPRARAQAPALVSEPASITAATSVPGEAAQILDVVQIEIEIVERQATEVGGGAGGAYETISVRLKVTSHQETPRLLIAPRRFQLEADGREYPARPTSPKEVALRPTYLQDKATVSGWITFEVPAGANQLVLKTDLRMPPLAIALPEATAPQ